MSFFTSSPPVAKSAVRLEQLPDGAAYERDTVTLGWEDRLKTRARRRSDGGFDFAVSLPRGTVLREGDALVFDDPHRVVIVRERQEAVFIVRPRSSRDWALWAYHIGNSHQPLMIADDGLVCIEVPGMEQVLTYHGIPFVRDVRAFTPESMAPGHHGGG